MYTDPAKRLSKEFPNISPKDLQPLIMFCSKIIDISSYSIDTAVRRLVGGSYFINPDVRVESFTKGAENNTFEGIKEVAIIIFSVGINPSDIDSKLDNQTGICIDIPIPLRGSFFAKWLKAYHNNTDYAPKVKDEIVQMLADFDGLKRFIATYDNNKTGLSAVNYARAIDIAKYTVWSHYKKYADLTDVSLGAPNSLNEPENGVVKDKTEFYNLELMERPSLVNDPYLMP